MLFVTFNLVFQMAKSKVAFPLKVVSHCHYPSHQVHTQPTVISFLVVVSTLREVYDMHNILWYISIHGQLLFLFFYVTNKIVNTKEAILTYDKYYIKDDGVAELGQLHFCSLQISFSIQTFWSHIVYRSELIQPWSFMTLSVILLNILFCTLYLYCMSYMLHYITSQSV
jgi:hypothetical protein